VTSKRMTKAELAARLHDVASTCNGDPEHAHAEADALLLSYIGDADVTEAFDAVEKWYA
jgi:hypothetical protein